MSLVLVLQHQNIARCRLNDLNLPSLPDPSNTHVLRIPVAPDYEMPSETAIALEARKIDFAVLPDLAFSDIGLIVSDMDSTLITIECIDEIAAGVGLKTQIAAITEQTMRGELDFEQSVRRRVGLLKGLQEQVLQQVYDDVLKLTDGAEYLISQCHQHGVKFLLVSGGFTFFTDRLQQRLQLDYAYANVLEHENGVLTGNLMGRIIDAQAKADLLREYREKLGLTKHQVIAVGDGANDIAMIEEAGFGIAFHAKPKTRERADLNIRFNGLEAVRGWFR